MIYQIDNDEYIVNIERKNNKNTYIRVKEDLTILVTTNYLISDKKVKKLLDKNYSFLVKTIEHQKKMNSKKESFYLLGNKYDVITLNNKEIEIIDDKIYVKSYDYLEKWLKKETKKVFQKRLDDLYNKYEENIPYPGLRIRKMKTRWGVCNKKTKVVTLNSELIKYSIDKLDYVIIHELSHFLYFDHSPNFWKQVSKYCPNYKKIRKDLKD